MTRRLLPPLTVGLVTLGLVVALPAGASRVAGQAARPGATFAIRGATVLTVTRGTIPNGTVLVRDGKIAAVGADVQVPPGVPIVDGAGKFVSPGIIDEHSHIATDDINEGGTTVSSMTSVAETLNPTDIDIYRDLAGGVTIANVLHGSANPIGGENAVIKLRWGKTKAANLLFDGAVPGIKFALGENPKRPGAGLRPGPRRYPATREGVEFVIRDAFTRAKAYQKAWQDYRAKKAARRRRAAAAARPPARTARRGARGQAPRARARVPRRRDADAAEARRRDRLQGHQLRARARGLQGRQGDRGARHRRRQLRRLVGLQGGGRRRDPLQPRHHGAQGRRGGHQLRQRRARAPAQHRGGQDDEVGRAAARTRRSRSSRSTRRRSSHIDKRVGSIEAGKDADLVIWTHHPLSTSAIVDRTYIDGIAYYDRTTEAARLAAVEKEKAALVAAEAKRGREDRRRGAPAARDGAPASPAPDPAGSLPPTSPDAPVLAIVNARVHPVTRPTIERGAIVMPRRPHRGGGRRRAGAGGREGDRREGPGRLPRLDRRRDDARPRRARPGRLVRRHDRAPRLQPRAPDAGGLQGRQRRHPNRARQRRHRRRVGARRRHPRRRGAGHEARRLDVGRGHGEAVGRDRVRLPGRSAAAASVSAARAAATARTRI